jgi:hypothetical protein
VKSGVPSNRLRKFLERAEAMGAQANTGPAREPTSESKRGDISVTVRLNVLSDTETWGAGPSQVRELCYRPMQGLGRSRFIRFIGC